jgi:hypothetical protein
LRIQPRPVTIASVRTHGVRQCRKLESTDFGFPAFCWRNFPLCLSGHSCEGYRDGSKKANSIRWQAQEEIQDRDPKDGSA